ncbi:MULTISPECIES: molybdopterin-dependent oxidoreductase [Nocardiopsis]|uniref:molybdopterin-dependent oxidoreductase n=1 Tax=Nocardiopsis TaxID=2013 RepID=UPI002DBFB76C|nr:molybdopterin-dependent oxidoreductase [Nocardiopsis sp. LDBS1602]MEC3895607.1 molybdopterin-dependent oxidoreductase [Nocardiopsis sp. LDBS1602]
MSEGTEAEGPGPDARTRRPGLPPGQRARREHRPVHYGRVPSFRPERWDFRVFGTTESLGTYGWSWEEFSALPSVEEVRDFHCVLRFTVPDVRWTGVRASDLVRWAPPSPETTHVMAWGEYGYSANLRIDDFLSDGVLLATHRDGEPLSPEHGYPLRLVVPQLYGWKSVKWLRSVEYMVGDRRGFWEERGYHNRADPWGEERFSEQEGPEDGPPL